MKYGVVYFTRTNNCKRIAEKIASMLPCEIAQITDDMNWHGIAGFFRAGYYSSNDKEVDIHIPDSIAKAEEYIVVTPLWAGGIAPAARTFLKTIPTDKVHLVVASIGNHVKNRSGFKSVSDITKITHNEGAVIEKLVEGFLEKKK